MWFFNDFGFLHRHDKIMTAHGGDGDMVMIACICRGVLIFPFYPFLSLLFSFWSFFFLWFSGGFMLSSGKGFS